MDLGRDSLKKINIIKLKQVNARTFIGFKARENHLHTCGPLIKRYSVTIRYSLLTQYAELFFLLQRITRCGIRNINTSHTTDIFRLFLNCSHMRNKGNCLRFKCTALFKIEMDIH